MELIAQLHPRLVHFPIAFFILYFFFEASGIILKKNFLSKSAHLILAIGVVCAIFAVLTGNQAATSVNSSLKNSEAIKIIDKHEFYATITLWYFFALLILRTYLVIKKRFNGNLKYLFILLGIIGCYFIYITGIHGGELVFKYGIGTEGLITQ
jgi:uncharacterized membrane protein